MPDLLRSDSPMNTKLLEYILQITDQSTRYWTETVPGTRQSRQDVLKEYRLRYAARRSVAQLMNDVKTIPFRGSSNIGIGLESIFGEYLVPVGLQNSVDLEPSLEAVDIGTGKTDDAITKAHDDYLRNVLVCRNLYEQTYREVYTVGSVVNKWTWGSLWRQKEVVLNVLVDPRIGQPIMRTNPQTGQQEPITVDPKMPPEMLPVDPFTGQKAKVKKISSVEMENIRQGPQLAIRPLEAIDIPYNSTDQDPDRWNFIGDNYTVDAFWLLSREGDPFEGKIPAENLKKIWNALGVDPDNVWRNPNGRLTDPIKIKEVHLKFPMTSSGLPVELIALIAVDFKILLTWRLSPFSRRPFFNHQVWGRTNSPLGIGIPESVYGLRNVLDAMLNQDVDAGNLYNHPPLLLSSLAMLEDEDYETTGPGTTWIMQDINGARFLPPAVSQRNPMEMLNWIISMMQRKWGVTDLNMNAPTSSLSPNVSTATGVNAIINQGTVKFGHLTKRFEATRTQELQFVHDMKSVMLTKPELVSINGKPSEADRSFYREGIRIRAVGDGVYSNPNVRQQMLMQGYQLLQANPFVGGDIETWHDYTEQLIQSLGIPINIKDSKVLQQAKMAFEISQNPIGQQMMAKAAQLIDQQNQMQGVKPGQANGHAPQPSGVPRPPVAQAMQGGQ